jgi:hypothetical protein
LLLCLYSSFQTNILNLVSILFSIVQFF